MGINAMTFEEVKRLLVEQSNAIEAILESFTKQEETHGVIFRWNLFPYYAAGAIGRIDDAERGHVLEPRLPALYVMDGRRQLVELSALSGHALARYAALKIALEGWLAGTGPWPEPEKTR